MAQQQVGARRGGALLVAGVLALAACSSTPGSSSAASSSPSAAATSAAPTPSTSSPVATSGSGSGSGAAATSPSSGERVTSGVSPVTAGDQSSVLSSLPGSAKSGCVAVGERSDVRSGTMAAGNFVTARKAFADQAKTVPAPTINLYLIPADARTLRKVTLTLEQVGGQHLKRTFTSTSVQDADQWKYFAVQASVPAAGTWRLRATSNTSTGCFDVVFG